MGIITIVRLIINNLITLHIPSGVKLITGNPRDFFRVIQLPCWITRGDTANSLEVRWGKRLIEYQDRYCILILYIILFTGQEIL
jgi:hypothetical protein